MQIQKHRIPILMYHSISCTDNAKFRPFTVSPASFAEQMAYLQAHAYTALTVTQFVSSLAQKETTLPERPVILTFDDGFADFFAQALPVLKHYRFVATLYVATAFVNGTSRWLQHMGEGVRPMLTWKQLAEISSRGIECSAHSHSHPQLDTLHRTTAEYEIVQSKKLLEHHLSKEVRSFAYPFGYYTPRLQQLLREAGYTSACAVRHAMSSQTDDPLSLARLMVRADTTIEEFAALLTGRNTSPVTAIHTAYARARTPLWQLIRRCQAFA